MIVKDGAFLICITLICMFYILLGVNMRNDRQSFNIFVTFPNQLKLYYCLLVCNYLHSFFFTLTSCNWRIRHFGGQSVKPPYSFGNFSQVLQVTNVWYVWIFAIDFYILHSQRFHCFRSGASRSMQDVKLQQRYIYK